MRKHIDETGFAPPATRTLGQEKNTLAFAELIAAVGLTLGTAVAAIVVSAGIARADVAHAITRHDTGTFVTVLVFGLLALGFGSFFFPIRRQRR
jgi:hypothetical protein